MPLPSRRLPREGSVRREEVVRPSGEISKLYVTVHECRDLHDPAGLRSRAEPFVQLTFGPLVVKTSPKRPAVNPRYDETFEFAIKGNRRPEYLAISILDGRGGAQLAMGEVRVDDVFPYDGPRKIWIPLYNKGSDTGEICLKFSHQKPTPRVSSRSPVRARGNCAAVRERVMDDIDMNMSAETILDTVEKSVAVAEDSVARMQAEVDGAEKALATTTSRLDRANAAIAKLKQENRSQEKELGTLEAECAALRDKYQNQSQELEELITERNRLRSQAKESSGLREECRRLQTELRDTERQLASAEQSDMMALMVTVLEVRSKVAGGVIQLALGAMNVETDQIQSSGFSREKFQFSVKGNRLPDRLTVRYIGSKNKTLVGDSIVTVPAVQLLEGQGCDEWVTLQSSKGVDMGKVLLGFDLRRGTLQTEDLVQQVKEKDIQIQELSTEVAELAEELLHVRDELVEANQREASIGPTPSGEDITDLMVQVVGAQGDGTSSRANSAVVRLALGATEVQTDPLGGDYLTYDETFQFALRGTRLPDKLSVSLVDQAVPARMIGTGFVLLHEQTTEIMDGVVSSTVELFLDGQPVGWQLELRLGLASNFGGASKDWQMAEKDAIIRDLREQLRNSDGLGGHDDVLLQESEGKRKALEREMEALRAELIALRDLAYLEAQSTSPKELMVTVLEAKDLDNTEWGDQEDPYIVMRLGDKEVQTSVKNGLRNPCYNEEFKFPIGSAKHLEVEVMDGETDAKMGKGHISLEGMPLSNPDFCIQEVIDLSLPDSGAGQVCIKLEVLKPKTSPVQSKAGSGSPSKLEEVQARDLEVMRRKWEEEAATVRSLEAIIQRMERELENRGKDQASVEHLQSIIGKMERELDARGGETAKNHALEDDVSRLEKDLKASQSRTLILEAEIKSQQSERDDMVTKLEKKAKQIRDLELEASNLQRSALQSPPALQILVTEVRNVPHYFQNGAAFELELDGHLRSTCSVFGRLRWDETVFFPTSTLDSKLGELALGVHLTEPGTSFRATGWLHLPRTFLNSKAGSPSEQVIKLIKDGQTVGEVYLKLLVTDMDAANEAQASSLRQKTTRLVQQLAERERKEEEEDKALAKMRGDLMAAERMAAEVEPLKKELMMAKRRLADTEIEGSQGHAQELQSLQQRNVRLESELAQYRDNDHIVQKQASEISTLKTIQRELEAKLQAVNSKPVPTEYVNIRVIEARDMVKVHLDIDSEVYVVLQMGECQVQTDAWGQHGVPQWNQTFRMPVPSVGPQHLSVELWQKKGSGTLYLGGGHVPVATLMAGVDRWVDLQRSDVKLAGRVHISTELASGRGSHQPLLKQKVNTQATVIKAHEEALSVLESKLEETRTGAQLYVTVMRAKGLKPPRDAPRPKPFVVMRLGTTEVHLDPSEDWYNPVWNKRGTFAISESSDEKVGKLQLVICDEKTSALIGRVTVPLDGVDLPQLQRRPMQKWLDVRNQEKSVVGSMLIRMTYRPGVGCDGSVSSVIGAEDESNLRAHGEAHHIHNLSMDNTLLRQQLEEQEHELQREREHRLHQTEDQAVLVTVIEAQDLGIAKAMVGLKQVNPFVRIKLGLGTRETSIRHSTCNPTWNESFAYQMSSSDGHNMTLDVYDKAVGVSSLLGSASIDLTDVGAYREEEAWYPVELAGKVTGNVLLRFQYQGWTEALQETLDELQGQHTFMEAVRSRSPSPASYVHCPRSRSPVATQEIARGQWGKARYEPVDMNKTLNVVTDLDSGSRDKLVPRGCTDTDITIRMKLGDDKCYYTDTFRDYRQAKWSDSPLCVPWEDAEGHRLVTFEVLVANKVVGKGQGSMDTNVKQKYVWIGTDRDPKAAKLSVSMQLE